MECAVGVLLLLKKSIYITFFLFYQIMSFFRFFLSLTKRTNVQKKYIRNIEHMFYIKKNTKIVILVFFLTYKNFFWLKYLPFLLLCQGRGVFFKNRTLVLVSFRLEHSNFPIVCYFYHIKPLYYIRFIFYDEYLSSFITSI